MRARPTTVLLPLLLAAAGCNTNPASENGAGAAQELECSASLSYGGCVRGSATKEQHGYHTALLRRGDRIRVRLARLDGDLNPGLALKSPKYSLAVRHESVTVREDSVDKIWTIQSTGFYTVVAFPWSNRGAGTYQIELACEAGPCLAGETMDAEVAGACIGEARDCALGELADADPSGRGVPALFDSCLRAEAMPAICATACAAEGACGLTVDRLRPFAGRGAECIEQVESCIDDCVPHNTTADAITDLTRHPEMMCWAAGNRANCASFGMGLASCRDPEGVTGEGYAVGSEPWCNAVCLAREGDALNEMCTERCVPQPGADDETPDLADAEAAE